MSYDKEKTFNDLMKMISNLSTVESQWERVNAVHDSVSKYLENIYDLGHPDGYAECIIDINKKPKS